MISLIHPSRGRPKKAYETAREWIDKSGLDIKEIDYVLSLDHDDPTLKEYYIEWDCEIVNNNTCVVEATNKAAEAAKGDILVYLSDDFKCPENWGKLIIKEFEGVDTPLVLKVDDKLQDFSVRVLTMPVMNRHLYNKLGYFFNPLYKSMWVDCDLYEVAFRLHAIKYCKYLFFPHEHVSIGKAQDDETYRRSAANWDQGKAVFERRRKQAFGL